MKLTKELNGLYHQCYIPMRTALILQLGERTESELQNVIPPIRPMHIYSVCICTYTSLRIFHRPTIMIKSVCRHSAGSIFGGKIVSYFLKKIFVVNPYRVLCLKTSRILTRLFLRSQRRQGLSSFGQDVFFMTFPTPLLTSHIHPQHFVGLTTNCAVNGIWYSIFQQSPIGINASCVHPNGATSLY